MTDIKHTFTENENNELDKLIERFKSNDQYFAYIQRKAVTFTLTQKLKENKKPTTEERLLKLIVKNRF